MFFNDKDLDDYKRGQPGTYGGMVRENEQRQERELQQQRELREQRNLELYRQRELEKQRDFENRQKIEEQNAIEHGSSSTTPQIHTKSPSKVYFPFVDKWFDKITIKHIFSLVLIGVLGGIGYADSIGIAFEKSLGYALLGALAGLSTAPILLIAIKLSLAAMYLALIGGLFYFVIKFIASLD
jgi:hypothetical protein